MTPTFELVVREHGPLIRRIARSYEANRALVDEIVQDIYLALWEALPRFRGDCRATDLRRQSRAQPRDHARREGSAPAALRRARRRRGPTPRRRRTRRPSATRRASRLEHAVAQLPLGQRLVVTLALEGFSPEEIANVLGIGVSAASVRLHRAKASLQAVIDRGALMNESEWNELQRLWKSSPPQAEPSRRARAAAPAATVARRRDRHRADHRRRGLGRRRRADRPRRRVLRRQRRRDLCLRRGGLRAVGCGRGWRRSRAPRTPSSTPSPSRGSTHACGVRHAAATIWALVVGMVFTAVMALARGLLTTRPTLGRLRRDRRRAARVGGLARVRVPLLPSA